MRAIINTCECFKNTYRKSYLVRLVFTTTIQESCKLEADNICKCDSWFPKNNKLVIKYDIVCGGKFSNENKLIEKSIIVDISSVQQNDFDIELIITNSAGLYDSRKWKFSEIKEDFLMKLESAV